MQTQFTQSYHGATRSTEYLLEKAMVKHFIARRCFRSRFQCRFSSNPQVLLVRSIRSVNFNDRAAGRHPYSRILLSSKDQIAADSCRTHALAFSHVC